MVPSFGELRAVAYIMVAERENQTFTKQRESALIVLANARVWESEGWRVMISDGDGKEFNPAAFEELLGPGYSWSPQEPLSVAPSYYEQFGFPSRQEASAEETEQPADPEPADSTFAREPFAQDAGFEEVDAFAEVDAYEEIGSFKKAGRFEERGPFVATESFAETEPFMETEPFAETEPFEETDRFDEVTTFEELEASYERLVAHR
jgi:hypothetical protein